MAKRDFMATACIAFVSIVVLFGAPRTSRAGDEHPLSAAQTALFESDHLAEIRSPATLDYIFRHDGREPYEDTVVIVLRQVHDDGSKDVSVEFLTGEHRMEFSPVTRFHGNPLIMYFLEWDVLGMQRATGGSALYFRNRIRAGFVDQAEIAETSITIDGSRPEPATVITLQPYRHDPGIGRYAVFSEKRYRFVLSASVPGRIYEIEASLPADVEANPSIVDRVTYRGIRK
jgi:hypothetical protein